MTVTVLTKTAAQKFATLCETVEENNARVLALVRKIKTAEVQLSGMRRDNDEAAYDALADEIKRLDDRRGNLQSAYLHDMRVTTAIRTWLADLDRAVRTGRSVELRDVEHPRLTIESMESTDGAVDSARAEIEKLQNARRSLQRAVPPIEDLYLAASARVQELAARGRPAVAVDRGQLHIRFPVESSFSGGAAKDALAIMAWLHPDAMVDKLHKQIDEVRENDIKLSTPVMPMAERDRRLADIERRILELERQEEYLIVIAEGFNLFVPRREDANPLAVLGLSMHKRERAVA